MFVDEKRLNPAVAPAIEKWRQVLLDAADILEREGWCQNLWSQTHSDGRREHCMIDALIWATAGHSADERGCGEDPFGVIPTRAMQVLRHRCAGHKKISPMVWNDTEGRTKEEVIAMLRGAAGA